MSEENNSVLNPKISVIIPVFNAEQYLRQCLDSVLSQSLRDIEVICVDDGSTDSSLAILNEYKERDTRIKVIHQENLHAGVARNNGLKQARGEYIHFLDADDWIEKDVYYQWYAIAKDKDADVCGCERNHWDAETDTLIGKDSNFSHFDKYITMLSMEVRPQDLIFGNCVPWNKLYRRKFLVDNNIIFDNLICANDRYFYFQVIFNTKRFFTVKEWWINHRMKVSNSLTGDTRAANYDCHFKAFSNIWNLFKNSNNEIKQMVLRGSIGDFLYWYEKAKNTPYESQIKRKLAEFLMNFDSPDILAGIPKEQAADCLEIIRDSNSTPVFNTLVKMYEKALDTLHHDLEEAKSKHSQALKKYGQISNSKSYKLGRLLSFPYRKTKGGIRCYKEHGFVYTLKRCWQKITGDQGINKKTNPKILGLSDKKRSPRIIISLTSYPPRIKFVSKTIITLLDQSFKPNKLLLWLAEKEFSDKEKNLPGELLELRKYGLEICWCENLGSYKKLIPALRLYPEDIIVTVDDDAYFDKNLLKSLVDDYEKNKAHGDYIYCHRVTKFFKPDGEWHTQRASRDIYSVPTYLHKICSGAGTLFPPGSLHEDIFNERLVKYLAPTNDDIGIWFMAILAGRKIKPIEHAKPTLNLIQGSQEAALWKSNDFGEKLFWKDFNRLIEAYPQVGILLDEEYKKMWNIECGKEIFANMPFPGKENLYVQNITGNEFGEYKDIKELRKKAGRYYKQNLQGNSVINLKLSEIRINRGIYTDEIPFTGKGRKEMLAKTAQEIKLFSVRYLDQIIRSANFITKANSYKEKHGKACFYYLHALININDEKKYIVITVKECEDGKLIYYNHNIYNDEEYRKKLEDVSSANPMPGLSMSGGNSHETSSSN